MNCRSNKDLLKKIKKLIVNAFGVGGTAVRIGVFLDVALCFTVEG
jgi:hypothetical protein